VVLLHGVVVVRGNARALNGVTAHVNLTDAGFEAAKCALLNVGVALNPSLLAFDEGKVGNSDVCWNFGEQQPGDLAKICCGAC
jgi:hypothetical protein